MKPRIAFYAPIKPPDHAIVSGDREIARLMVKALERAGYQVEIASHYIAYQKRPSAELFKERKQGAEQEFLRLSTDWAARSAEDRPSLWFSYHPYCKAPDWLGPAMIKKFDIPYATAEACRTHQATDADWAEARLQVQAAVKMAEVNFCLKQSDLTYLNSFIGGRHSSIVTLAPFVDVAALDANRGSPDKEMGTEHVPLLLAVGMMRPGWKARSFVALADALKKIADLPWKLVIIGDGPARAEIEAALRPIDPSRLQWTGAIDREDVLTWFRRGDILAWPGLREAVGMVFLEAQSQGLPVVAFNSLGVPLVVDDGTSGLLVPEGDVSAYADALRDLLKKPDRRMQMGNDARRYVAENHDISGAVRTFATALGALLPVG